MTLKASMVLAALALSCFPQSATAQGNLVFNGGFDTSASGWTLTGTTGIAFYNVKNGNPPGDVVLEGLTASATQTVNGLIAGTSYIVSGDYQGLDGSLSASPNFEVTMNGTILFETVFSGNVNWENFGVLYTASSSDAVLTILASSSYCGIDNISVEAVPEPDSLCLIGVGGMMSAMFFRNRREKFISAGKWVFPA